jgi:hypothetical protein
VQQYCCAGLNFGYFYDASHLIAYDGEAPPSYTMYQFTPSTVPGCRTPHVWLDGGQSLYDAMGHDYALLRTDPTLDVSPLLRVAQARGIPMRVVDITGEAARGIYQEALVLSRPDQHVAWRGQQLPDNIDALLNLISGTAKEHT